MEGAATAADQGLVVRRVEAGGWQCTRSYGECVHVYAHLGPVQYKVSAIERRCADGGRTGQEGRGQLYAEPVFVVSVESSY
jgi:hypothetical protein